MPVFSFRVNFADVNDLSLEEADNLYQVGCSDATFGGCDGVIFGIFERDADTLESAIRSAIADIDRAGFAVAAVEPFDPIYTQINGELAEKA